MGVFAVLGTLLCCIYPKVNACVLITFGVPTAVLLVKEINRSVDCNHCSSRQNTNVLTTIALIKQT
jgi:hypothetical protein